jgi:hypothetical protein
VPPETSWEKVDHRQPFPRAEVSHVGPGWDDTSRTERVDQTSHFPFDPLPPVERLPLPVRPSDAELRQQLQHALDAQRNVDENLRRAEDARGRAEHLLQKCQQRLAEFATLDAEVIEHKVTALKCDVDVDLSDGLRRRIADRDLARTDLHATEEATSILRVDLAQAAAAAGDAAKAVEALKCSVLNTQAEGIAVRFHASMREAERCVRALAAFDMFIAGRGGVLPGLVRGVLLAEPKDMRVPASALGGVSVDAWQRAGDALKADVQATVSMDDLLPPPPPPPMTFTLNVTPPNPAQARFLGPLTDAQPADSEEAA